MTNRAKYWQRMVTAWEASGLSQAEFCRLGGLKAVTFGWWKQRLAKTPGRGGGGGRGGGDRQRGRGARRQAGVVQKGPAFVEVALSDEMAGVRSAKVSDFRNAQASGYPAKVSDLGIASASGYEVALPCGTSIRLPVDFDVDRASQLISAVAQSC